METTLFPRQGGLRAQARAHADFRIAQAQILPPAFQGQVLSPPGVARSRELLGEVRPEQLTFERIEEPRLTAVGAVVLEDGRIFAVVNMPKVREQASVFALDPGRLAEAVAEQEVAQKIVQTSSRFAHISKQNEELIGEAAMLQSYPATALRTLERTAQTMGTGGDYAGMVRLTIRALDEALAGASRRPGAPSTSGEQALNLYKNYVTAHAGSYPTYPAIFSSFARDVLKVEHPGAFAALFESRLVSIFRLEALALTKAR